MRSIEKIVALFCIIVFLTFLLNHGHLDFSGVDWVKDKTTEIITSEEGQQYIEETKEISKGVFHDLFYGIKELIIKEGDTSDNSSADSLLIEATLLSVESGSTIKVKISGEEVRLKLCGIDAPDEFETDVGIKPDEYLKALLEEASTVYIEYDEEKEDKFGNPTGYIWISDNTNNPETNMINAVMIKNGYAVDKVTLPNTKYSDVFIGLRKEAKEQKTGLWQYEGFTE